MKRDFMIAVAAALAIPSAALAHHGWSTYDEAKTIKLSAPLTGVRWANPHGTAKVQYQGKQWDVVLAPVSRMEARGLTQAMIGPKQTVTLVGYPRRDGTPEMRIERVIAGDKTVELR